MTFGFALKFSGREVGELGELGEWRLKQQQHDGGASALLPAKAKDGGGVGVLHSFSSSLSPAEAPQEQVKCKKRGAGERAQGKWQPGQAFFLVVEGPSKPQVSADCRQVGSASTHELFLFSRLRGLALCQALQRDWHPPFCSEGVYLSPPYR